MARPFEVGDMVIVPKSGSRNLKTIERIKYEPNMAGISETDTTIFLKPYGQCKPKDIKTIRAPRKGSKEARGIVARLAHDYRKEVLKYHNEHFKRLRCCYIRLRSDREWLVFDREKSMLK